MEYDMRHKHHKEIKAWADGAEIEEKEGEEWRETDYPSFYGHIEYRVKPVEPVYEWQWLIKHNHSPFVLSYYYSNVSDVRHRYEYEGYTVYGRIEPSKREVEL